MKNEDKCPEDHTNTIREIAEEFTKHDPIIIYHGNGDDYERRRILSCCDGEFAMDLIYELVRQFRINPVHLLQHLSKMAIDELLIRNMNPTKVKDEKQLNEESENALKAIKNILKNDGHGRS